MPDPAAPLDAFDPAQFGALIANLAHATSSKGPFTPPTQSAQPPLADLHARQTYETVGPPDPPPETPSIAPMPAHTPEAEKTFGQHLQDSMEKARHPYAPPSPLDPYAKRILFAPLYGAQQAAHGASTLMRQPAGDVPLTKDDHPLPGPELARGFSDVIGGSMQAASPLLPGALLREPLKVGAGLLVGGAADVATRAAGEKLGIPPEYVDLASHAVGLGAGVGASHLVGGSPAAMELENKVLSKASELFARGKAGSETGAVRIGPGGPSHLGEPPTEPGVGEPPPTPPRGLYSRIDEMFNNTPAKLLQPKTVRQMLERGADPEEVAWRNLPRFIESYGDNNLIPVESLKNHLAQNPAPFPNQITLGEAMPPMPFEDWDREWRQAGVTDPETIRRGYEDHLATVRAGNAVARPTENGRWVLAGGENYREKLFQLRQKPQNIGLSKVRVVRNDDGLTTWQGSDVTPDQLREMQKVYDGQHYSLEVEPAESQPPGFRSHVYHHSPDLIGWSRYNERNLPAPMTPEAARLFSSEGVGAQRASLKQRMDALVEQMRRIPFSFSSPAEYHASPAYAEQQRIIAEHNVLNDQYNTLSREGGAARALPDIEDAVRSVNWEYPGMVGSNRLDLALERGRITPEEARIYGYSRGYRGYEEVPMKPPDAPTGPRVRHIEENQSDLHQRGEDEGYATRPADYHQQLANIGIERARAQDAFDAAETAHQTAEETLDRLAREHTRASLPPEWQHLQSFGDALDRGDQYRNLSPEIGAIDAWRDARQRANEHPDVHAAVVNRNALARDSSAAADALREVRDREQALRNPKGVPDLPFKKNWEDLFLKQHAIDVAADPTLEGLTLSSGRTQNERYNLGQYVSKLEYDPDSEMLSGYGRDDPQSVVYNEHVPLHKLDESIGKTHGDLLRQKVAEHQRAKEYDRAQWTVEPAADGEFRVIDSNGEILHDRLGQEQTFPSASDAHEEIDYMLKYDMHHAGPALPSLAGGDFEIGGEGMREAYDKRQRRKLEKLLAPHGGGKVLAVTHDVPAGGSAGPSHGRNEPAWYAPFSQAMKASINKKGFSLAALLLALQRANVGQPPPVQPVPSHDPTR